MTETLTNRNLETTKPTEIFNINSHTDTVIACIEGESSSPKITQYLMSRGHDNYRCLSGGLLTLSDYFQDVELSEQITGYFSYIFGMSLQQRIVKETGKSPFDYYGQLEGKNLYIITHKIFLNLQSTITQQRLTDIGVQTIKYFPEEKNLYTFLKNHNL